jgi:quercetin dioxygenase-like cupin family protein
MARAMNKVHVPQTGAPFAHASAASWIPTDPGVKRQVLAHGPDLMLVRVAFEAGAIGPEHHHPHSQNSLVERGRFEITIGGQTRILGAGDSFYVPGNVPHSAKALEAGALVDAFNPMREEFIAASYS